jgi:hypothetical protein
MGNNLGSDLARAEIYKSSQPLSRKLNSRPGAPIQFCRAGTGFFGVLARGLRGDSGRPIAKMSDESQDSILLKISIACPRDRLTYFLHNQPGAM